MKDYLIEIAGWIGVLAYLAAYLLLTLRILHADKLPYQALNVVGAAGLIISSIQTHDPQSIFVNVAWLLIGLWAVLRICWPGRNG